MQSAAEMRLVTPPGYIERLPLDYTVPYSPAEEQPSTALDLTPVRVANMVISVSFTAHLL